MTTEKVKPKCVNCKLNRTGDCYLPRTLLKDRWDVDVVAKMGLRCDKWRADE